LKTPGHDLLAIGSVVKAFGIEGYVIVQQLTAFPSRFRKRNTVLMGRSDKEVREMEIEFAAVGPRGVKVKFTGIGDRSAAEALVGSFLYVRESDRARPPKGHFYIQDIVGLTVVDETGVVQGTVREVLKMPAHDVYVVSGTGCEILIPAVKEFVLKIDLGARTMKVRLIEGMVEKSSEELRVKSAE
jgi:16S rRNA processing protein RimM